MLLTGQLSGKSEIQAAHEAGSTEALRQILSAREQREIGYSEAQEIGASLIEFYQVLAEEAADDAES